MDLDLLNLKQLVEIPDEKRDRHWENHFFDTLLQSKVKLLSDQPQLGPDHWPYILVSTEEEGAEPVASLLNWLSEKGIGLVVNPQKEYPDYIFTWGMVWHQRHTGLFRVEKTVDANQSNSTGKIQLGPPSQEYLPIFVREILKEFFLNQSVLNPRWAVATDGKEKHDLCFSLESLGNPDPSEHEGIVEAISWFLPQHYSVVLVSEKSLEIKIQLFFDLLDQ